jgi:hypothetical protein
LISEDANAYIKETTQSRGQGDWACGSWWRCNHIVQGAVVSSANPVVSVPNLDEIENKSQKLEAKNNIFQPLGGVFIQMCIGGSRTANMETSLGHSCQHS